MNYKTAAYKHAYWGYNPYIISTVLGKDSSQIFANCHLNWQYTLLFLSVWNDIKSVSSLCSET
jgi:hypothetical protein